MKEKFNSDIKRVTLKQLRALDAAVRAGTFSVAAQALNVTPPAITMQMRLLEEAVGLPLLERTNSGLRPTDAGLILLDAVHRFNAELEFCEDKIEALKGAREGRIAVGVVSTAKYFAPRALSAFSTTHPNIDLRLVVGNRGQTIEALREYEVDFAIMGRPPSSVEVVREIIGDNPHCIIAAPDHPMAGQKKMSLTRLANELFLLREDGSGTRLLLQRLLSEKGLEPTLGIEMGSNETIKQAVMAGMGIALISAHTVAAELSDGRLIVLDVKGLPEIRQWFVVKRCDVDLLPATGALWKFLVASGSEFLPQPW